MKTLMRGLVLCLLLGLILFLSVYVHNHAEGMLDPHGVIALAEKNLMITAVLLMLIPVVPIFAMLGFVSFTYRATNMKAKYMPDWHSNMWIEASWWAIPSVIIIILASLTWISTHELDPYRPLDSNITPITIQVVALDWKWLFIYPDERIATVNYVAFPKDVPISFKITSDAPMNAFFIPELAGQVYAMQGMTAQLHLMANEEGRYKGLSSNFSGDGFAGMRFVAHALSEEAYEQWLQEVKAASSTPLSYETYNDTLFPPSKNNTVTYYSSVDENLYTRIIMKFMPTMTHPTTPYETDTPYIEESVVHDMEYHEMPSIEATSTH